MSMYPVQAQAPSLKCCIPNLPMPVLEKVTLKAVLEDLLAQVEVRQVFFNRGHEPIEAVYTFPVPRGAVLLSFTARLGKRELTGRIMAAPEAEDGYEEAVTSGDAAILLQEPSPGLYTVNVGNLLPGEDAELTYRYSQLQYWQSGALRFALPTVIAPRYGDPAQAGLEEHQVPEHDFFTVHHAEFRASIRGALQDAEITCPTHGIVVERHADHAVVRFEDNPACTMDRDIVLNLKRATATPAVAVVEPAPADGGQAGEQGCEQVALLTFCPDPGRPTSAEPRFVKILVDCSGSMQGDSIAQARVALRRILDSLRPQDRFTIMAFGSTHRFVTAECVACTPAAISAARDAVKTIDADLGGTELRAALLALMKVRAPGHEFANVHGDVLLITDGETFDDDLVKQAAKAGGRVFTVGVGCAPGESLLGRLSEKTGGAAEYVTPNDDMAARIHRHFQRLYQPRVTGLKIQWPGRVAQELRDRQGGLFAGDTVHVLARLQDAPAGEVVIRCELEDGSSVNTSVALRRLVDPAGALPEAGFLERLMAASELATARDSEPTTADVKRLTELAVRCQLMSRWTSCLMVALRDWNEKTDGMPSLTKVQQMLAAGWQGNGLAACHARTAMPMFSRSSSAPLALRLQSSRSTMWAGSMAARDIDMASGGSGLDALSALGVPAIVVEGLRRLVDGGAHEGMVCLLALYELLRGKVKLSLDRDRSREIRRSGKAAAAAFPDQARQVAAVVAAALGANP